MLFTLGHSTKTWEQNIGHWYTKKKYVVLIVYNVTLSWVNHGGKLYGFRL